MVIDSGGIGKNRLNSPSQEAISSNTQNKATALNQATAAVGAKVPNPQDSVSLSGAGKAMHRLENKIQQSSAFDADKVAELKREINAGTYKPNPSAIADKLLADY